MTRLAWLTDIHLDHLRPFPDKRQSFAELVARESDCCVISGDISTHNEAYLLERFATHYAKPIYFVLGNHDYWGGDFESTEKQIRALCAKRSNLIWLTDSPPIRIAPNVELCGVDGWYDAQFGSWQTSDFLMVDWKTIGNFRRHIYRHGAGDKLVEMFRHRAATHAALAREQLANTQAKRVFFATHVPPYEQAALHEGQPSSPHALPWYTSRVLGVALSSVISERPAQSFTTLCGHVHSPSEFRQAENHLVLCGGAEYGEPTIVKVFDL